MKIIGCASSAARAIGPVRKAGAQHDTPVNDPFVRPKAPANLRVSAPSPGIWNRYSVFATPSQVLRHFRAFPLSTFNKWTPT